MTIYDYTEKIADENRIQEWFADEPATIENAVECIVEVYPLPESVTIDDVKSWVETEVAEFNSNCDPEHHLPTE